MVTLRLRMGEIRREGLPDKIDLAGLHPPPTSDSMISIFRWMGLVAVDDEGVGGLLSSSKRSVQVAHQYILNYPFLLSGGVLLTRLIPDINVISK